MSTEQSTGGVIKAKVIVIVIKRVRTIICVGIIVLGIVFNVGNKGSIAVIIIVVVIIVIRKMIHYKNGQNGRKNHYRNNCHQGRYTL